MQENVHSNHYDLATKNGIEHSFGKKKPIVGYVKPFSKI